MGILSYFPIVKYKFDANSTHSSIRLFIFTIIIHFPGQWFQEMQWGVQLERIDNTNKDMPQLVDFAGANIPVTEATVPRILTYNCDPTFSGEGIN